MVGGLDAGARARRGGRRQARRRAERRTVSGVQSEFALWSFCLHALFSRGKKVRLRTSWCLVPPLEPPRPAVLPQPAFSAVSASRHAAQDAAAGQRLARRWCSACHEIGRAPVHNDVSPSFGAIAHMSSTTAMSLNACLSTPHQRMPDYSLTRQEIKDVSAYILSLKQEGKSPASAGTNN